MWYRVLLHPSCCEAEAAFWLYGGPVGNIQSLELSAEERRFLLARPEGLSREELDFLSGRDVDTRRKD